MKVNTKTLTATREPIPMALIGLSADTLRNLQTALNPVPTEFKDIEFWDEVDATPTFDSATHTLDGTEILAADATTKTVNVVKGVRAKSIEELAAVRKAMVPSSLTPRQARLALLTVGLLDEVDTLLAGNKAMQIWWEYSLDIQRNHQHIVTMGGALGLTETQLDDLFIDGAKL